MEQRFHMLLYRAFHAQRSRLRPRLRELGLGPGQPKLLSYLDRRGPCRQKELADYFEVDPAAVSRMLEVLQLGGFLTRRTDDQCRRRDLVELTDAGHEAARLWNAACREMEAQMLQGFAPEERERFADYLLRARQNLQTREGDAPWET